MTVFSPIANSDIEKQIASLSRELAGLKKTVSRRSGTYFEDGREAVSDYYSDMVDKVSENLPALGRRAKAIENRARDNPAATAAVGLAALGLFAMFVFSRR